MKSVMKNNMRNNASLIMQLPEPFNFYRLILDSDHLHFGFWPENSPNLTLEEAQERMFERLFVHFPDPPATVLDVGCGLGLSAHNLSQKGYHVTAIAPSKELIDYASENYGKGNIDFHAAGFLDNNDSDLMSKKYDVILFQESLQYLNPLDSVFKKARSLLEPKGSVIIGDEICQDKSIKNETAVHLFEDVVTALFENGFRITANEKIGKNVIKTCDNVIQRFTVNFDQIVSSVDKKDAADRLEYFLNGWKSQEKWYGNNSMGYDIIIAKKDKIFIRAYNDGDEGDILEMFNKVFNTNRTIEHWYWKFRDNPFGTHKIAEAVTEDGALAGHFCGYPVPFRSLVGDIKDFLSFHIADTMTNPDFRNLGLGKTSVLARTGIYFYNKFCVDNIPFNIGYNTGNIRKFGERFLRHEYTSHVPYYVMDLNKKSLKPLSAIKRLISGFSVERVSNITGEYDFFFEKVYNDYGMLVKRKSSYLKWRYLECPDNVHKVFAVHRFGKLVGWSVFSTRGNVLLWGDALFDKKYVHAVSFMLDYLIKHFYQDITRIEGWFSPAPDWWTTVLRDTGFDVMNEPNNLAPGFRIFDSRFSVEFFEQNYYYTMGDSDLF